MKVQCAKTKIQLQLVKPGQVVTPWFNNEGNLATVQPLKETVRMSKHANQVALPLF